MAYTINVPGSRPFYTITPSRCPPPYEKVPASAGSIHTDSLKNFAIYIDITPRATYKLKMCPEAAVIKRLPGSKKTLEVMNLTEEKRYDIRAKDLDEIPVRTMRGKVTEYPNDLATLMTASLEEIISMGGNCSGPPIVLYDKEVDFNSMETELEVAWPVTDKALANKVLPPVHAASVIEHLDPDNSLEGAYGALYAWIKKNGYHPAYPIREIYDTDPQATSPEQLLIEIILPLKKEHD
ncbi:Bacterial transcription activator, effector binding domain [Pelotomaculum sp. FP]|nr:Bacterial transcription activator, effector binding domain [Pelotomaculum sp. FP]